MSLKYEPASEPQVPLLLEIPEASNRSNRLLQVVDLYWRSPESGDVWHKSRQLKKTIWWWQVPLVLEIPEEARPAGIQARIWP